MFDDNPPVLFRITSSRTSQWNTNLSFDLRHRFANPKLFCEALIRLSSWRFSFVAIHSSKCSGKVEFAALCQTTYAILVTVASANECNGSSTNASTDATNASTNATDAANAANSPTAAHQIRARLWVSSFRAKPRTQNTEVSEVHSSVKWVIATKSSPIEDFTQVICQIVTFWTKYVNLPNTLVCVPCDAPFCDNTFFSR